MKAVALPWLLEESNPAVRFLALTDVLGRRLDDSEVLAARRKLLHYAPVQALRKSQNAEGYWPPDDGCYNPKFTSTVWQLMLLGEMGVPRTPWIEKAVERFFVQHQMDDGAFCCPTLGIESEGIDEEPCLTGNMIRTLLALGYGDEPRVRRALEWLPESQFKDGGWNCDHPAIKFEGGRLDWRKARDDPTHSSFMSTIEPLWAYSEFPRAKWTRKIKSSIERAAEFLLAHRVYKSHRGGRPVDLRDMKKLYRGNVITMFHFPMYYYYDALHGLRVLTKLGYQDDERIRDALSLMASKQTSDGKWPLEGDWVRERKVRDRKTLVTLERLGGPSKWITLNCYRVLAKTGDLSF